MYLSLTFEQGLLHFHSALDQGNYEAGPSFNLLYYLAFQSGLLQLIPTPPRGAHRVIAQTQPFPIFTVSWVVSTVEECRPFYLPHVYAEGNFSVTPLHLSCVVIIHAGPFESPWHLIRSFT